MKEMKTARELRDICMTRDDWKYLKLWNWAFRYETKANEWNEIFPPVSDDRRLYINIYNIVYDAIESLSDNPNNWICVAIQHEIDKEAHLMDDILSRFR